MNSKAQKFAQEEDCSLLGQCFCKKSFSFDDKEIFEFGKWYYYFYDNDHRGLKSVKESWWVMYDFDGDEYRQGFRFCFSNNKKLDLCFFDDYFLTEKEVRKIKLSKIDEKYENN